MLLIGLVCAFLPNATTVILLAFMKSLMPFTFSSSWAPTMMLEVLDSELLEMNDREVSYEQE